MQKPLTKEEWPYPSTPTPRLSQWSRSAMLLGCVTVGACAGVLRSPSSPVDSAPANADDSHAQLFAANDFPSAVECGACHVEHYEEWSISGHAYTQISPIFNTMQAALVAANNGTLGDFCIRCHTPVGMALGEPVFQANSERADISVEGVTCIVCHRVNLEYGKVSARFPVPAGDIFEPVYGPREGDELERVLGDSDTFRGLTTDPDRTGRKIHAKAHSFFQSTSPAFCGRCHDVRSVDGFRLEDAFSEYKRSPAAARGTTCQDCHMGITPGVESGYAQRPAAVVGGVPTRPDKHTNHMLTGPDYPVVHPGIFPQNPAAKELATPEEWIQFDHEAGWGTDEFEDEVDESTAFPERWAEPDDRYDARDVLDEQLDLRRRGFERSTTLLKNGYGLRDVSLRREGSGLLVEANVENLTDGHNVPTGFSSERLVYLRVTVTGPDGEQVYASGDFDPDGNLRDEHSRYVHEGLLPLDEQLLSLQSHFIARNQTSSERSLVLPVNLSQDPLPFHRPSTTPSILTGGMPAVRLEKHSIPPGGIREGRYPIPAELMRGDGKYEARVEIVAGMLPVNLIAAIQHMGFDYGLSAQEVANRVLEGHRVVATETVAIEVKLKASGSDSR